MKAETIQYVIVGAALVLAAAYLLRCLRGKRRKGGCCGSCGSDTKIPRN